MWLTNQPHDNRARVITPTRRYSPDEYPRYDDCPAINVDRLQDIPKGYTGLMGVPSSIARYDGIDGLKITPVAINHCPIVNGKIKFKRFILAVEAEK